jgi:hypothetical protein
VKVQDLSPSSLPSSSPFHPQDPSPPFAVRSVHIHTPDTHGTRSAAVSRAACRTLDVADPDSGVIYGRRLANGGA